MDGDTRVSILLTIIANTAGQYSVQEVIELYTFIKNEYKETSLTKLRLVKEKTPQTPVH